jgi:hypothetical protein
MVHSHFRSIGELTYKYTPKTPVFSPFRLVTMAKNARILDTYELSTVNKTNCHPNGCVPGRRSDKWPTAQTLIPEGENASPAVGEEAFPIGAMHRYGRIVRMPLFV